MRRVQNRKRWPDRHDPSRIDLLVRHVVVPLDVVEVHRLCDARRADRDRVDTAKIRVVDDPSQVAFEVAVINGVEADQGAKSRQSDSVMRSPNR